MLMKIINGFFALLFILSAALQYNDPDPYVWIPIYLTGAYLCIQAIRGRYPRVLYVIATCVYAVYALYLLFDTTGVLNWFNKHNAENIAQSMKATKPYIEETREFFGLVLLMLVLGLNMLMFWWRSKRNNLNKKSDT